MKQALPYHTLLSEPHLTGSEWAFLQSVRPRDIPALTGQFECDLCAVTGSRFALATQSGTAALELAFRTLGVKTGDFILCPTLTFAATANAIAAVGATPVFIGAEPGAWGLDPDALQTTLERLPQRPRAIVVVDVYGMPAHWDELWAVADAWGVPLVADGAESLGSRLHGKPLGTQGCLNVLSFNQNKVITTLGGGALLTKDPRLGRRAQILANQGRQTEAPFEQLYAGGNYRINPMAAGVGLVQLPVLPERVARRQAVFAQYAAALAEVPGLAFQPEGEGVQSNRWLTALTIEQVGGSLSRDGLGYALGRAGIETRPVFAALHRQPAFRGCRFYGSALAESVAQSGLCLPSGSTLTDAVVARVIRTMLKNTGPRKTHFRGPD